MIMTTLQRAPWFVAGMLAAIAAIAAIAASEELHHRSELRRLDTAAHRFRAAPQLGVPGYGQVVYR